MFNIHREELDWGGRKLVLETGKIARQADGAVLATYGETTVLATVVAAKQPREGIDFLPLTVNYQEKIYAAGRIPGGYFKREGRPTEKETLVSRLIDRPIRPLFADGWRNETQVIVTTLSHDLENDPDILAMVAASAALTLSGAPFMGPIGAARVGFINDEYVLNPHARRDDRKPARSRRRRHRRRRSDGGIGSQGTARRSHARRRHVRPPALPAGDRGDHPACRKGRQGAAQFPAGRSLGAGKGNAGPDRKRSARGLCDSGRRWSATCRSRCRQGQGARALLSGRRREPKYNKLEVAGVFKELEAKIVRWNILDTGKRIDGRDLKTVRQIIAEVGVLPRAHGSALFTRGETQALVVTTLGTGEDEQWIDALQGTYKEIVPAALQLPALLGR